MGNKYYSLIALYKSPQLHTFKLLANNLPNLHLVPSNLCIFQSPLQRPETYPVPLRSPRCFRIVVGHSLLHCLYQIPSHFPYYLVEVVWVVGFCYPHRQIFVAQWVFTKLLELAYPTLFELRYETRVL